jgi:hypothetical protein
MALIAGCDTSGPLFPAVTSTAQAGTTTPGTGQGNAEAEAYCTSNGGKVQTRYPASDTNSDNPLRLHGSLQFCQFMAEDGSQISVSLDTLYSDQPTLAALAYLQKPRAETAPTGFNPGRFYCDQLGGTDEFGDESSAAGGWILDESQKADTFYVMQTCIFPDLSTIDSFGLFYNANNIVRGTDLSKLLRFQIPVNR